MIRLIIRQLSLLILVCLAIVLLAHLGMNTLANRGADAITPAPDTPIGQSWEDTVAYLRNLTRGDLGEFQSFSRMTPVENVLWPAYWNSMGLLVWALVIAAIGGLLLGAVIALARYRYLRMPVLTLTAVGISVPSFLAVVLLQQIGLQLNSAVGRRMVSMAGFEWTPEKMLLPVLILAARPLAHVTRTVYVSLKDINQEDYIRTAYSKGLTRARTFFGHALKNLAVPYLSALGVAFRFSLTTLILVEFLFAWPGLGQNLFTAIGQGKTQLVVGLALAIGLTVVAVNFILDLLYHLIDPRVREEG
jgi:ABC-type dipeptide/oligopeptide/nickel transport system permease component